MGKSYGELTVGEDAARRAVRAERLANLAAGRVKVMHVGVWRIMETPNRARAERWAAVERSKGQRAWVEPTNRDASRGWIVRSTPANEEPRGTARPFQLFTWPNARRAT